MAGHSPIKLLKMFSLSEESVVLPPPTIRYIYFFIRFKREDEKYDIKVLNADSC